MKIKFCLLSLMASIHPVYAAQAAPAVDGQSLEIEDIVVTATKSRTAQDTQDVNAALTAYDERHLDRISFANISSLSNAAPNVQLDQAGTFPGYQNFSIRGLGIYSTIVTAEPTVGVFVDGVYQGINAGVVFDNFDLAGVEILRGPQGVLFGRNVTAGAVLLKTNAASLDRHNRARVSYESRDSLSVQDVLTGALIGDKVAGKLAVYLSRDGGYFTNLADGQHFGKSWQWIVRPALRFVADGQTSLDLRAEMGRIHGSDSGTAGQNHALFSRQSFDFETNEPGFNNASWASATVELNRETALGDGKLTYILGYRRLTQDTLVDIDGTKNTSFHIRQRNAQSQLSNELRYAGQFGRLAVTLGGFFFRQNLFVIEQRQLASGTIIGGGDYHHKQWAIFANGDYALGNKVTLNSGLRYSHEYKSLHGSVLRPDGCSFTTLTCIYTFPEDSSTYPESAGPNRKGWGSLSAKFGLQYKPDSDTQFYGYWARSFRSGGYNIRLTAAGANPGPFDQEAQSSFELGLKRDMLDRRLRLNAAAFHNSLYNIQREISLPAASGTVQNIVNAGTLHIYGIEIDGLLRVSRSLTLTTQAGYLGFDYGQIKYDLNNDGAVDEKDRQLMPPRLSPWSYGASLSYQKPWKSAIALASLSFTHRDWSFVDDRNQGRLNAVNQLDGRLGLSWPNNGAEVAVFGRNLLNRVTYGLDTQLPDTPAFGGDGLSGPRPSPTFSPLAKGRVIGLTLSKDW